MGRVSPFITTADCYLFGQGTHYEIYHKLGAHPTVCRDEIGVHFAVWAPMAVSVYVAGSFNDWSTSRHPMTRIADSGIFQCFIPGVQPGDSYMYAILTLSGTVVMKADPYGVQAELRPAIASVVANTQSMSQYSWHDADWMARRLQHQPLGAPYAIYEVHLGSWKQAPVADVPATLVSPSPLHKEMVEMPSWTHGFLNYRQLAHELADYVLQMGYTHVELMGIAEHPYDGSWGYQVTGFYAPTSRHGSPQDFMYLVDYLHQKGIGVILDWVPAHFSTDPHGLAAFDGTPTYEYADPAHKVHPHWGTYRFDYSKPQVANFLMANALYWIREYHVDGLRVDAVASMLYRNYGQEYDQASGQTFEGIVNTEAADFLRRLNQYIAKHHPGVVMMAEDSTTWPGVTSPQGLGFTFKWNLGWMHDVLDYMQIHPMLRSQHHHRMTFSMTYAFSEQFILPFSHDEVVHGKRSLLSKMPGSLSMQIANLKAAYAFMMGHPGKKLLFMGQDLGQPQEWNETAPLDWDVLEDANHRALHNFVRDLLHLYQQTPALYEDHLGWNGFSWIQCDDSARNIFRFVRTSADGKTQIYFVCNFSSMAYEDFRFGVPRPGSYQLVMDQQGLLCPEAPYDSPHWIAAKPLAQDDLPYSISQPLAAYGVQVYRFNHSPIRKE